MSLEEIKGLLTTMRERLHDVDYGGAVYYENGAVASNTSYPTGTPTCPVNNIRDAKTIADNLNIRNINIHGAVTLVEKMEHYNFFGAHHESAVDTLDLGSQDVDSSSFRDVVMTGAQGGSGFISVRDCVFYTVTLFNGVMENCALYGSALSFKDTGYPDLERCYSIHGAVTITVQAPTRGSIKDYSGNLILTAQDGGTMFVRGMKGSLTIDAMTGGTLSVYADAADITINADCTSGTINIYGNAKVTGAGGGVTINNYTTNTAITTIDTVVDTVAANTARILCTPPPFWSDVIEEIAVTGSQSTIAFTGGNVVVSGIPSGATITRVIFIFMWGALENTNGAANKFDAASALPIQIDDDSDTGWLTCMNFVDDTFGIAATTREGAGIIIGNIDIKARVDGDDTYDFQWLNAKADQSNLQFNNVQVGLQITYSL